MAELNGSPIGVAELTTLALTNFGHFTAMRVEDGRVRGLSLHLERLVRDCRAVFAVELNTDRVLEFARRAAPASGAGIVRVTIFDPKLDMSCIGRDAQPRVLVTARPASTLPLPPLRVQTVEFVRNAPEIKSVDLFGSLRHRREAKPGPVRAQGRRLHQPLSRAAPSAFNDASSDMLDDDTGFRCCTANLSPTR